VVACKVHQDRCYTHEWLARVGGFHRARLGQLERTLLQTLDYRLAIDPDGEFARVCRQLGAVAQQGSGSAVTRTLPRVVQLVAPAATPPTAAAATSSDSGLAAATLAADSDSDSDATECWQQQRREPGRRAAHSPAAAESPHGRRRSSW
jgi:hypothetical protein